MKLLAKFALILFCIQVNCKIRSVDYAVDQVTLSDKAKTTINGQPAINLVITNVGEGDVWDVVVTVKAKRQQIDISTQEIKLGALKANESITGTVIFSNLGGHEDYDLLTYAVKFSSP